MRKSIYIVLFVLLSGNLSLVAQANKKGLQTYRFQFQASVNAVPFSFDSIYQNHSGEAFKVRSFKYYVSHIRLVYEDGKTISIHQSPLLINEADSSSRQLQISAPKGTVTGVRFLLGIDSLTNVNGVQTGDLDPAKGMFWIWNTGYIMAKLEGFSPQSKAPGKQYSYDVGGYKPGESVAREINLPLPSVTNHQPSTFIINADISKWFYGKNEIKISEQAMCHSPGNLAMQVADNYAAMFSIKAE